MAGEFLADHPGVVGTRELKDSVASISVPATSPNGFEVYFRISSNGDWIIGAGNGWHENGADATIATVREGIDSMRHLLSPSMRIRELRSRGKPYRWLLERRDSGTWEGVSMTGLLFWNYFGARSERTYQNAALPEEARGPN
jgi:hypothetical protein